MVQRLKKWFGFGSTPVVGIEFRDDGAYLAMIRPPDTVVGLGRIPLATGTVVDGRVRNSDEAGRAVSEALADVYVRRRPPVRVAVPPQEWSGVTQPGVVTVGVHDLGATNVDTAAGATDGAVRIGGLAVGTVAVAEPVVRSAVAALKSVPAVLVGVEPSPVSVARFLRVANPAQPLRFARLTEPDCRWTMCDAVGSFELEVRRRPGRTGELVAGTDQARLGSVEWGSVSVEQSLEDRLPRPELFTPAVGAALGEFAAELSADVNVGDLIGNGSNLETAR